jgi:sec-independent protein translocase protein TatC
MISEGVAHEARMPLLAHVDELRMRLIVSVATLAIAFGFAFWQNHAVLNVLNRPLANATAGAGGHSHGPLAQSARTQAAVRVALDRQRVAFEQLARISTGQPPAERRALTAAAAADSAAVAATPSAPRGRQPVTLGISEPFSQTLTVSAYFALLLALPVLLFELYAFVVPAVNPGDRRILASMLTAAPLLFAAGVTFGYLVVLPGAVGFLQNFNASSFDALVQARGYYQFVLFTLLATGVLFQIPLVVIGLNRMGVLSTRRLREHRRYAIVGIVALALVLPGTDPVTTVLELIPMLVLFELSIVVATVLERRAPIAAPVGARDERNERDSR